MSGNAVRCSRCGKAVSEPFYLPIVVRAWVECPECVEAYDEWISVENELPQVFDENYGFTESDTVLCFSRETRGTYTAVCELWEGEPDPIWRMTGPDCYHINGVTHWQPLPQPPKR